MAEGTTDHARAFTDRVVDGVLSVMQDNHEIQRVLENMTYVHRQNFKNDLRGEIIKLMEPGTLVLQ